MTQWQHNNYFASLFLNYYQWQLMIHPVRLNQHLVQLQLMNYFVKSDQLHYQLQPSIDPG